jgi:hypothetical protein
MCSPMKGRARKTPPQTDMRRPRTADMTNIPMKKAPVASGMMRILPIREAPRQTFGSVDPNNRQPSY